MRLRIGLQGTGRLAWFVVLVVGCGRHEDLALAKEAARPDETAAKTPPAAAADAPLTDPMRADFGAAAWIPEDASFFSSTLRLREQWKNIAESRAFKKVLILPFVQMALGQVRQHPMYRQLFVEGARNPLVASALEVAADAVSGEIFLYADPKLPSFIAAVNELYFASLFHGVLSASGGRRASPSPLPAFIDTMLRRESEMRVPPFVIGFRLAKPDAARSVIAKALEPIEGSLPAPLEKEEAGGGSFRTLRLGAGLLPEEARESLTRELEDEGVQPESISKFNKFVDSQTLAISVGFRGDYLLLSVGSDSEHLKKLGKGRSLAESAAFAPIRRHHKAGLVSLTFLASAFASAGDLPVDECLRSIGQALKSVDAEKLPDGIAQRVEKDARSLIEDVNRGLGAVTAKTSASYLNRGVETFSFCSASASNLDTTKALSILDRAGESPMLAVAARGLPSIGAYDRLARWVEVGYGYFKDLAVPRMQPADRAQFNRFDRLFIPAVKELHETTKSLFLPAIDGCQDLFTLDGGGILTALPDAVRPLAVPLKFLRPLFAIEVNDAAKLTSAFARYRETLNRFFHEAERELKMSHIELPEPVSRPHADGTLYTYRLPALPVVDFEPHALVTGKLVVLALSAAQSKGIVESSGRARSDAVDLAGEAGMAYQADLPSMSRVLFVDLGIIVGELVNRGMLAPQAAGMIRLHLPEIEKALSALKSVSGRVYGEGGFEVHHSWLRVEDVADD